MTNRLKSSTPLGSSPAEPQPMDSVRLVPPNYHDTLLSLDPRRTSHGLIEGLKRCENLSNFIDSDFIGWVWPKPDRFHAVCLLGVNKDPLW